MLNPTPCLLPLSMAYSRMVPEQSMEWANARWNRWAIF